ncbi:AAA family ATPase [Halomicronema hongdechloris C2206]|uniref:AAA family ATPase n=1 Tax=Halomicronema hongdechloris C2206 TaxID=1641165 RepID=A0A1Z3HPY2_9CYAN|nr:AAA family ATPase [Halomicronema hongdechloris]ASC72371.1 AAA family ATPase [Halomicronema hongdechloris C2206]
MDLFDHHREAQIDTEAPLAARMRPRTLDEFIGQEAVVGPGRLLRRAIQADQLSSLIFYGPPGTGKTTLARIIANTTKAHFIAINAVLAGVKDIRDAIATAQDLRGQQGRRTILFVDEVHRFNKAQQDALLPWVENGTVILIGATTENPYFEVNQALVSRSRIFQLQPLQATDLKRVAAQALADGERGYGHRLVELKPEALDHLVNVANGDARALLNALELAVETTEPQADGTIEVSLAVAEESIQRRAVLYDKDGDAHFDTISAFIKSVRGSDPDAALYWLARMVYAGEDPRYVFRRLVILASEDIGLADPQAVTVVTSCAAAFDRVGMPEGRYPLAQATLYLATAAKSNSVMAFFDALATVEQAQPQAVPNPLRDANRDKQGFGHGQGYLYPHAYREHWVAQQYLPTGLQGQVFYQPSSQGYEATLQPQVCRRREAQLAAVMEGDTTHTDILTNSPDDPVRDRWLQRTLSQTGSQLGWLRDRIFALAAPQRHHVILDLQGRSGLLTWEAVRQVPEGGVYVWVASEAEAQGLQQQAAGLPELSRPLVITGDLQALPTQLTGVRCDRIVGRHVLGIRPDKSAAIARLADLLPENGRLVLAETVYRRGQRPSALIEATSIDSALYQRWQAADEQLMRAEDDPRFDWKATTLQAHFQQAGLICGVNSEALNSQRYLSPALLQRWFTTNTSRPSYRDRLGKYLSASDLEAIAAICQRQLAGQTVSMRSQLALFVVHR